MAVETVYQASDGKVFKTMKEAELWDELVPIRTELKGILTRNPGRTYDYIIEKILTHPQLHITYIPF